MKTRILSLLIQLVFLVVFNVWYFTIIEKHTDTRWVCYGAIHIAYLLLMASVFYTPAKKRWAVHGYPKMDIAHSCFVVTLGLGILLAIINTEKIAIPVILLTFELGAFILQYLILLKSEAHVELNDKKDTINLRFIKQCRNQLQEVMSSVSDSKLKKEIEKAYDAICSAQVVSVPSAEVAETNIISEISQLKISISDDPNFKKTSASVGKIIDLIRHRDDEIRMSR
jgi:hypothetical protein